MKSDTAGGYDFTFSEGLLKKDAIVEFKLKIDTLAQDGWTFSLMTLKQQEKKTDPEMMLTVT